MLLLLLLLLLMMMMIVMMMIGDDDGDDDDDDDDDHDNYDDDDDDEGGGGRKRRWRLWWRWRRDDDDVDDDMSLLYLTPSLSIPFAIRSALSYLIIHFILPLRHMLYPPESPCVSKVESRELKIYGKIKMLNMPTTFWTVIIIKLQFLKSIIACKLTPHLHNLCIFLNFQHVI